MGDFAVGQAVFRLEDSGLLKGGGRYVDALSVYGIRHIPMPATSERIWR